METEKIELVEKKQNGALVGSIIIIAILVIGAVFIWQSKVAERLTVGEGPSAVDTATPPAPEAGSPSSDLSELEVLEGVLNEAEQGIETGITEGVE